MQNYTIFNITNGLTLWNISCADNSENYNINITASRNLTVATDTDGPAIYLEDPPSDAQVTITDVFFKYNVSDLASGVVNCSLFINGSINWTNNSIQESRSQNFSIYSIANGDYVWWVNCTDDCTLNNNAMSEKRNLTIGLDTTPPVITLQYPPETGFNDTDGTATFRYKVNDYASDIANCSIIIDGKLNQTNSSYIYENKDNQNFTIANISNSTHTWQINCTDKAAIPNQGNSSIRIFLINLDFDGPAVALISPQNNSLDSDGHVTFSYNVSDAISDISNCSLIINNQLNRTNTSVVEGAALNFMLLNMSDGQYNWSVNCSDNSDSRNTNSSETRNLTVLIDNVPPAINLSSPANNTLDTDGIRIFYYNVSDYLTNITSCSLIFNGQAQKTNTSVREDIIQNFSMENIANGQYNWSVNCTDGSDNHNVNASEIRNFTVMVDITPPSVRLISPDNFTQDFDNNVFFI